MSTQYANPETVEKIEQKREELTLDEGEESVLSGQDASSNELEEAKQELAGEDQPGADLPGPVSKKVAWRGTDMEWDELGHSLVRVSELHESGDVGEGELLNYIIQTFAVKSRNEGADEEYWQQFDLIRDDDVDGLMDLFERLIGESDGMSDDARERAEKFRNE